MPENGNGNGVTLSRLSMPAVQAVLVIIAAISVAGTFVTIWLGILGRISAVETKVDNVGARILGDRFPGLHRRDLFEWCLQTESLNPGWLCHDPYLLPSGREEGPLSLLRPEVNRKLKADRR